MRDLYRRNKLPRARRPANVDCRMTYESADGFRCTQMCTTRLEAQEFVRKWLGDDTVLKGFYLTNTTNFGMVTCEGVEIGEVMKY